MRSIKLTPEPLSRVYDPIILMIGPPGAGKSMLAARLPGLRPPLDPAEAVEVSMVHSIAGGLADGRLMRDRSGTDIGRLRSPRS